MMCEVYIFPLEKRIGRVRRVADVYDRMSPREGASYWRGRVKAMYRELGRLGCTPDEIEAEVLAFRDAVSAELLRRELTGASYNRPDGAA